MGGWVGVLRSPSEGVGVGVGAEGGDGDGGWEVLMEGMKEGCGHAEREGGGWGRCV